MRIAAIISALLSLAVGLFLTFPPLWLATLLGVLCVITLQIMLVRRHLHRQVPSRSQQKQMAQGLPLYEIERRLTEVTKSAQNAKRSSKPTRAAATALSPTTTPPAKTTRKNTANTPLALGGVDPSVFKRFQQHLKQANTKYAASTHKDEGVDDVQDIVNLSASTAAPTKAKASAPSPQSKGTTPPQSKPDEAPSQTTPTLATPAKPTDLATKPAPIPAVRKPTQAEWEEAPTASAQDENGNTVSSLPSPTNTTERIARLPAKSKATPHNTQASKAQRALQEALAAEKREAWSTVEEYMEQYGALLRTQPWDVSARALHVRATVQANQPLPALESAGHFARQLVHLGNTHPQQIEAQFLAPALQHPTAQTQPAWRFSLLLAANQALQQHANAKTHAWHTLLAQAQESLQPNQDTIQTLDAHLKAYQKLPNHQAAQRRLLSLLGKFCFQLKRNQQAQQYYKMELALTNPPTKNE